MDGLGDARMSAFQDLSQVLNDIRDQGENEPNENADEMALMQEIEEPIPDPVRISLTNFLTLDFPGEPSTAQRQLLIKIITANHSNNHCLIELPNDKERIQAILVGVLFAAQNTAVPVRRDDESDREDDDLYVASHVAHKVVALPARTTRKVYVVTQSADQMKKVIQELKLLKNTDYLEDLKLAPIIHRDVDRSWFCICQHEGRQCVPPSQGNENGNDFKFIENDGTVHSIEELFLRARRDRFCPYIYCQQLVASANFIICSQDVISSPFLRQKYGITFDRNCILIFDDGENIEKICEKEVSVAINTRAMKRAAYNLWRVGVVFRERRLPEELNDILNNVWNLSTNLKNFAHKLDEEKPSSYEALHQALREGFRSSEDVTRLTTNLLRYVRWTEDTINEEKLERLRPTTIPVVSEFLTALKYLYDHQGDDGDRRKFVLKLSTPRGTLEEGQLFQIICPEPAIVFQRIYDSACSIIIGSRCLPSTNILREQLGSVRFIDNTLRLADQGVTSSTFFAYCLEGPRCLKLEFAHKDKARETVHAEVGHAVLDLCRIVPNGIILFFSSRGSLREKLKNWGDGENRSTSILTEIKNIKHLYNELDFDNKEDATVQVKEFIKSCKNPSNGRDGALMLALHRGNVNELMEFRQGEVRLIVNVGLPYHSWIAETVEAKRNYFLSERGVNEQIAMRKFYNWYNAEAYHIINQTFARPINQRQAWYAVIVLDYRMQQKEKYFDIMIPNWIRDGLKKYWDFNVMIKELRNFVNSNRPPPLLDVGF